MRISVVLCVIVIIFVKHSKNEKQKCDGINVRGKFHRKEVLARGLNRPYQLSYYKHEHTIFFSYNVGKNEEDKFNIGYIKKDLKEHKTIHEVENGFATAIDKENHVAYFGGSTGIYKYDINKNESKIEKIIHDHNIWDMFFHKELYFINYPMQHLYKYNARHSGAVHEHQSQIHEKIYQFAIDGDNDIFIANDTGLYQIKNGTNDRILYKGANIFRAIEINNKGEVYICGQHAIFVLNKNSHMLEEIAHIRNIFGLTFDSDDNIIFSDPREIVKLLPEKCK